MTTTLPQTRPDDGHARVLFDAVLRPNASLSPRGFVALMVALCAVSFTAGAAFMLAGAWPVFGFFGLDVLLVYIAFRVSYWRARRYETVRLTEDTLVIERVDARGRTMSWRFQPYWLRVAVDERAREGGALTLSSHGRTLEIGTFLAPHERHDFARALEAELGRLRHQAV